MEKPISIVIEETRNSIIDIINESKLHPSIVESLLKGIYLESLMLSNDILNKEKKHFFDGRSKNNKELKELAS